MSGARGVVAIGHRGRAARQDDAARREVADRASADRVGVDFAVDAVLAHPPRDQLGDLAAEIEDQDAVGHAPSIVIPGLGAAENPESILQRPVFMDSGFLRWARAPE